MLNNYIVFYDMKIKEIEVFIKNETKNTVSITHDFGHLKRTASGAKWFAKILGGGKKEQRLAYIAGLFHDIVRPVSSKICHAKASAKKSKKILKKFKINKADLNKVILTIRDHSERVKWESPLHASVFLADKILEQMGAFVVFRRCMYVGECVDYKKTKAKEAIIDQFRKRLKKFNPDNFPRKFSKILNYQYAWPKKFLRDFENKKTWVVEVAESFYRYGEKKISPEMAIEQFKPKYQEGKKYKKEALEYIKGKKFKFFNGLIK